MQVESKLRFSISASADNAWNMASSVPSSRHLANRAYTDCQGPYASGNSRHCAPLRAIQSIPLSIFRSSFRGRPRFPVLSGGSTAFTRSHCPFVNSYRFMPLFYTSLSFVQYLFFKQGLAFYTAVIEFLVRLTFSVMLLFYPVEKFQIHIVLLGLELIAISFRLTKRITPALDVEL